MVLEEYTIIQRSEPHMSILFVLLLMCIAARDGSAIWFVVLYAYTVCGILSPSVTIAATMPSSGSSSTPPGAQKARNQGHNSTRRARPGQPCKPGKARDVWNRCANVRGGQGLSNPARRARPRRLQATAQGGREGDGASRGKRREDVPAQSPDQTEPQRTRQGSEGCAKRQQ